MINSLKITNHLGDTVTIDLRNPEKSGFLIRDISGLDPVKATVNMTSMVSNDGALYNSARLNTRNIVLSIAFSDADGDIEKNRRKSYRFFPIKQPVFLQFDTDGRVCETYGYVESNQIDIFSKQQGSDISIICPDPYFYSVAQSTTVFSNLEGKFEFPFSNESLTENLLVMGEQQLDTTKPIFYAGDAPVGIVIYVHAMGSVTNLTIFNLSTNEKMAINSERLEEIVGSGITEGDDIIISTMSGNKFVIFQRDGTQYNILNSVDKNPDWFKLSRGNNIFAYTADTGLTNLQFRIVSQVAYEGI